ncbi:hypothetical protein BTVI_81665 [Pitangus sulphuratus]|nr:hypothetical protein BTVI_81665 [Pitangus sulphuratus]
MPEKSSDGTDLVQNQLLGPGTEFIADALSSFIKETEQTLSELDQWKMGERYMCPNFMLCLCKRERDLEDYSRYPISEHPESSFAVIDFKLINDLHQ